MTEYLVFAKDAFEQDLTHRGSVSGTDRDAAREAALHRFGTSWVEMKLIPEGAIRWVLRSERDR